MPRPRKPISADWPGGFLADVQRPALGMTMDAQRLGDDVVLRAKIPGANFGSPPVEIGCSDYAVAADPEAVSLLMTPEQARRLAISLLEAAE